MDKLISVLADIIIFFEYFSFFYVVLCRDFRKKTIRKNIGIMFCVLIWLLGVFLDFGWSGAGLLPVSINELIMFLVIYLLFDITISQYIPMAIGEYLLLSIMGLSLLIPLKRLNINDDVLGVICNFFVVIILCIYYLCVCKKREDNTLKLPVKMWWIVDGIMYVLTLMMTFFSYVIVEMLPSDDTMAVGHFMSVLGSVFICILLFVLMYYYNSSQDFRLQKELAEIENEQQRIYFKGLLDKEEETRQFRHDIINDLLEIKNYSSEREYDKLNGYIDSTLGEIMDISKSSYDVGNDIINTIINYYLQPIKNDCDIEVIGYMSNDVTIDERDLCTVCANLIKNATEEISKLVGGKIIFSVEQGKQYLSFVIENTYIGNIITDKSGNIITQKADKKNHGIGINNVKRVVRKYEGKYETDIDDNMFRVKIFFKL